MVVIFIQSNDVETGVTAFFKFCILWLGRRKTIVGIANGRAAPPVRDSYFKPLFKISASVNIHKNTITQKEGHIKLM
jgi:hypothetical protein